MALTAENACLRSALPSLHGFRIETGDLGGLREWCRNLADHVAPEWSNERQVRCKRGIHANLPTFRLFVVRNPVLRAVSLATFRDVPGCLHLERCEPTHGRIHRNSAFHSHMAERSLVRVRGNEPVAGDHAGFVRRQKASKVIIFIVQLDPITNQQRSEYFAW